MKLSLFSKCVAAALSVVLSVGAVQAVELVENGGFETGDFTGWQQFPNGGTQMVSSDNPASGMWSANLDASTPDGAAIDNLLKSANRGVGVVMPNQPITVSFDLRGTVGPGGVAFVELFSEFAGGGATGEILGGGPLFPAADPNEWTTYTFNTTTGADVSGGVTLQLKSSCGAVMGCVSDLYFDNASMQIVPEPSSLLLVGSALSLLGCLRRRGK